MNQKQKVIIFIFMLTVFATSIIVSQTAFASPTVKTIQVNSQATKEYIYASGMIVKGAMLTQNAKKDTYIKELCVNIGDYVKKGDVVMISADDNEITAEYSGTVNQIADITTLVFAEQMLITYTDIDTLTALVNIPENDVSHVKKGQLVELTGSAFKGKTYKGEINALSAEATVQSGSVCLPVTVKISEPDSILRPNFTVKAKICVNDNKSTLSLPKSAVGTDSNGEYVWVVNDNKAVRRSVTAKANGEKYNVEKGLVKGENVVENALDIDSDTVSVNVNVKAVR